MINKISIGIFFSLLIIMSGCMERTKAEGPISETELVLGTVVTIQLYDHPKEEILDEIFTRLKEIEDKMTINAAGSEVDAINDAAGKQEVSVSEDTFSVIQKGLYYSELSREAFDISIGPLVKLWNIGTDYARVPSEEEIQEKIIKVGFQNVEIKPKENSVLLKNEGMTLDLGGIAKGFAADEVVKILNEQGVKHAMINLGGNVFAYGEKTDGGPWRIGVQNPFSTRGEYIGIARVKNKSVVTSGIYERYFEENGKHYHHILDTKTGYPVDNNLAGVSIISEKSIDGDALSTAAFSLGIERGSKLIESLEGVEAIFITRDKEVYTTSGVKDFFEITDPQFTLKD